MGTSGGGETLKHSFRYSFDPPPHYQLILDHTERKISPRYSANQCRTCLLGVVQADQSRTKQALI